MQPLALVLRRRSGSSAPGIRLRGAGFRLDWLLPILLGGGKSNLAVALSDSAAAAAVKPGDRLGGRYKLERLLGQGAAGQVWAGVHETIGRPVAVKILRNESKGRAAVRFLQEARIAAQLQSRYVVSIFDFGNTPSGLLYMVMEYLHGETLGARLARSPALRVKDLLRYMTQALTGLHEVHRAGIIHRDLKPENIFLVEEGGEIFPKILDFGVSRADDSGLISPELSKLTATGMTVGTPVYMAPEQARGKRDEIDPRTDLYALGVLLYKAISGEAPFGDSNVVDLLMAVVSATVAPALCDVRPDVPVGLSEVIQKAMAPRQDQRYADAEELRQALSALQVKIPGTLNCLISGGPSHSTDEHVPLSTLIPPTDIDPTMPASFLSGALFRRPRGKARWLWPIAGALVALVAGIAVTVARRPAEHKVPVVAPAHDHHVKPEGPLSAGPGTRPTAADPAAEPAGTPGHPARKRPEVRRRAPASPAESGRPRVFRQPDF